MKPTARDSSKPVAILFANLKGNVGDFAILHAMLLDISAHYPDCPIHVFTHPLVAVDELRFAEFRRQVPSFDIAGRVFYEPSALYERFNVGIIKTWPWFQSYTTRVSGGRAGPWAERFANYAAIFFIGGGLWHGRELGQCMFGTLLALHDRNTNIFAYPFSVNTKISQRYHSSEIRRYFSLLRAPIVVRDTMSRSVLESIGVPCRQGRDSAFMLRDLVAQIGPRADRDRSRVLFAVKGHAKDLEPQLAELVSTGRNLELITSCAVEDEAVCRELAGRLGVPFQLPLSWQELAAELRASSLIVSNRLHCLIFGTLVDTPILPVTNRQKSEAYARDAGLPCAAANERQLSKALIDRAMDERSTIVERMKEYRDRIDVDAISPLRDPSRQQ